MTFRSNDDDPETLRTLGTKCRSLARGASSRAVAETLSEMATDYERAAAAAERMATHGRQPAHC
jgi:hypothetical protein